MLEELVTHHLLAKDTNFPPLESKTFVSVGKLINTTFMLCEPRLQRKAIQSLKTDLK